MLDLNPSYKNGMLGKSARNKGKVEIFNTKTNCIKYIDPVEVNNLTDDWVLWKYRGVR